MKEGNAAEDQDTIDEEAIADLSAEDLDDQLKTAMNGDADAEKEEEKESDEEGDEEDPEKDEEEEEKESDEEGDEEDPEKDEEEPETDLAKELADAKEANEKLQAQMEEKEKFAQRKANDEGELRKRLDALEAAKEGKTEEELNALHDENPAAATQAQIDNALAKEKTRDDDEANARRVHTETTKGEVEKVLPDFMGMVDEIAVLAGEQGVSPDAVKAFKADPYGSSDAGYLVSYGKQVLLQRKLETSDKRIKELETKPDDVAEKIAKAAKKKPGLNGKKSSPRKNEGDLTPEQIANMTDDEVDERLKSMKK